MVIKDIYCTHCDLVQRDADVASCVWTQGPWWCPACRKTTPHRTVCNGGVRLKAYVCTFDGRDWSGDVQVLGVECSDDAGNHMSDHNGRISDRPKFSNDARAERRAQRKSARNRSRGKAPLFFDGKAAS